MKIFKRVVLWLLWLTLLLSGMLLPATEETAVAAENNKKTVRVMIDGKDYEIKGYEAEDSFWVTEDQVRLLTGICPNDYTKVIAGETCYNLAAAVHLAGYGYYSYDTVLDAIYIWSRERYQKETYDVAKVAAEHEVTKGLDFYDENTSQTDRITVAEFMELLDRMVSYADKSRLGEWQKKYTKYRSMSEELHKEEGMYLLFYAAEFLGGDYLKVGDYLEYHYKMDAAGEGSHKYDPNRYGLFDDTDEKYTFEDGNEWARGDAAYFYCIGRWVDATGEMVAGYDEANTSIHAEDLLTVKEAVGLIVRNIEASGNIWKDTSSVTAGDLHYVTYQESAYYDLPQNTVLQELLEKLENNTKESKTEYRTGFILNTSKNTPEAFINEIDEADIRHIAEWGFQKVRINAGFLKFFSEDMDQICVEALEKLDAVIAAGIRYHVQIEVCFDELPGWYVILGDDYKYYGSVDIITNQTHRTQAESMIRMFTKRYQKIPNDALSFCLFVEYGNWTRTNAMDFLEEEPSYTSEQISEALMELVDTVQEADADREIYMETDSTNAASEEKTLVTESAQKKNVFFTGNVASNYIYRAFAGTDDRLHTHYLVEWPHVEYGGMGAIVGVGSGRMDEAVPMVLTGELPAGSNVKLYLSAVGSAGTIRVMADGKEIAGEAIDPQTDKNAVKKEYAYEYEIDQSNIVDNYGTTSKCISFTLDNDADRIEIDYDLPDENAWDTVFWSGMCITMPKEYEKERWLYVTEYDVADETSPYYGQTAGYQKEISSKIYIGNRDYCSYDDNGDLKRFVIPYEIQKDLTYTTDYVAERYDKESLQKIVSRIRERAGDTPVCLRFETVFSGGTGSGFRAYYEDLLSAFREKNCGWLSNDFGTTLVQKQTNANRQLAGDEYIPYYEYEQFNPKVMKILKTYQKAASDDTEQPSDITKPDTPNTDQTQQTEQTTPQQPDGAAPQPEQTTNDTTADISVKAPKRVTIKSVKNLKGKKAVVSFKKIANVKGYQIQYASNKKFKKAKTKTVTKNVYTIKKLKKKKTYYIRVRAYKQDGAKKVYGAWSRTKKVKIKK